MRWSEYYGMLLRRWAESALTNGHSCFQIVHGFELQIVANEKRKTVTSEKRVGLDCCFVLFLFCGTFEEGEGGSIRLGCLPRPGVISKTSSCGAVELFRIICYCTAAGVVGKV